MSDLTDLIGKTAELSNKQFELALAFAGSNRAAIRDILDLLDGLPGIDNLGIRKVMSQLAADDDRIMQMTREEPPVDD